MHEDDELWFDSLAGRTPDAAGTDSPAAEGAAAERSRAEGASLRVALRTSEPQQPIEVDAVDPGREAALIARARAAGVLAPKTPAGRLHGAGAKRWTSWLAAAALACVAVGLTFQWSNRSMPPVVRGERSGIVRLRAPDPVSLKRELIQELQGAGVHATGYASFGRLGIDADLPRPLPEAVRAVLARHGIAPPDDFVLQVEIEPAEPP
jgi:hypothetical protein